jgi:hypothetical protein
MIIFCMPDPVLSALLVFAAVALIVVYLFRSGAV